MKFLFGRAMAPAALLLLACAANAAEPRSHHALTTGAGFGFQLYDARAGRPSAFFDHPYRFLSAPTDLKQNGPLRRNLLQELTLGIESGGTETWTAGLPDAASYLRQTGVIAAPARAGAADAETYYFAPFGLEANATVALLRVSTSAASGGAARLRFQLGSPPTDADLDADLLKVVELPGEKIERLPGAPPAWALTGRGRGVVIYTAISNAASAHCLETKRGAPPCSGSRADLELRAPLQDGWFGVAVAYADDASSAAAVASAVRGWLAGRPPARVLDDALAEWESWRRPPAARLRNPAEISVWRQGEAVLRMAQVREPNIRAPGRLRVNNGMILASLPPGGWSIGWVRDGTYATAALARMGHFREAKDSLDFFLNAEPIGKSKPEAQDADYRISATRYYGNGEEEVDYSGTPRPNFEMDGWGLFLWAARQYVEASGDAAWLSSPTRQGTVYEAMRDGVAVPLEKNLEPPPLPRILKPDSSIWEGNWAPRKHYAFSTLAAIRGLCDFSALAARAGRKDDARRWAGLSREIRRDFLKSYSSPTGLVGALERSPRTDLDGAMTEAVAMDLLLRPQDDALARRTLDGIERLKLASGGYKRNGGSDPYEIDDWVFIDLRLASAFDRLGRTEKADALLEHVTRAAEPNFGLLPEELNAIPKEGPLGAYAGSVPMVGYGSGAYALALIDRDGRFTPSACGDEAP